MGWTVVVQPVPFLRGASFGDENERGEKKEEKKDERNVMKLS